MKRFLSSPPWLLQSFKSPLFVFWSIKWSLPPFSSYCHLIDFFLKQKSDHISLLKILQWFHCLQANIHIFQHDLKALHWSGTNLPAPSFPIICQLHSPPLKYITPLYICSCCSLWIEHLTQFVPLISFKLKLKHYFYKIALWSTGEVEETSPFLSFSKTSNLQYLFSHPMLCLFFHLPNFNISIC